MKDSPGNSRYPIDIHRTSLGFMISSRPLRFLGRPERGMARLDGTEADRQKG